MTLARKMVSDNCQYLEAVKAYQLIPLGKKPGCRPFGIKVFRRVIGKSITDVVKKRLQEGVWEPAGVCRSAGWVRI